MVLQQQTSQGRENGLWKNSKLKDSGWGIQSIWSGRDVCCYSGMSWKETATRSFAIFCSQGPTDRHDISASALNPMLQICRDSCVRRQALFPAAEAKALVGGSSPIADMQRNPWKVTSVNGLHELWWFCPGPSKHLLTQAWWAFAKVGCG